MSYFLTIPNEILDEIVSDLDSRATFHLLLTCRSLAARVAPALPPHAIAPRGHMPALHWAAKQGHLPLVQFLLTVFPVDLPDRYNNTALHWAAQSCHMLVTEHLLLHGAAISRPDHGGYTALMRACRLAVKKPDAAESTIRLLLAHGADVHGDKLHRPLSDAIEWYSPHMARLLLAEGASAEARGVCGRPLIYLAVLRAGGVEVMKALMDYGADIDATCTDNSTALMMAAHWGFVIKLKILLDAGAKLNLVDRAGNSAFAYACRSSRQRIVEYLAGCEDLDINVDAAVYQTVSSGYNAALKTLLQRGASMNYVDDVGRSALHIAVFRGQENIMRTLMEYGADMQMKDKWDFSPLMLAIDLERLAMVSIFLDYWPDRIEGRPGDFATLKMACMLESKEVVEVMVQKGMHINMLDEDGLTVMAHAKIAGLSGAVEMLAALGGE